MEYGLTAHEIRLLELMCSGLSDNEIAGVIDQSSAEVTADINVIRTKLAVESRTEACVKAMRTGIVP
jgi:DNA-binding NarL/FixJ family response regulator